MDNQQAETRRQRSERIELIKEYIEGDEAKILSEEQLICLATESINVGCLKIARGAHSILLSMSECENRAEQICEELSTIHNERVSETSEIADKIWSRNIDSYDNNELENLVEALLIRDKSYLAQAICTTRQDLSIQFIADIESGRVQFDTDQSVDFDKLPTTIVLKAFCNEHRPLLGDISQNQTIISKVLKEIADEQVFFNAYLMPKQLLIPINAFDLEADEYKYDHPCMDAPSLLWENNLPELDQWTNSVDKARQTLESQSNKKRSFQNNWRNWPASFKYPKSVACRIGMASIIDSLWHSQMKSDEELYIIEDYCPAALIAQLMEMASDQNIGENENLIKFATDTSYLISILSEKHIIDLCCQNLLNISTIIKLPEPIQYILIDFEPKQLEKSVLGSERSTYPEPVPFIFEGKTLEYICGLWHDINQMIKKTIPEERLILINEQRLNETARNKNVNNNTCNENYFLEGICPEKADLILKAIK